jgi:putative ATP-dependent endonuclease of OLD family
VPDQHQQQAAAAPSIRRLTIERFRGVTAATWHPEPGVNVILGGGDVGKTTLLEAIALLLSPTNAGTISDTPVVRRNVVIAERVLLSAGTPGRTRTSLH